MNKKSLRNFIRSINIFEIIWLTSAIIALAVLSSLFPDIMFEDKNNVLIVIFSIISIIACCLTCFMFYSSLSFLCKVSKKLS